MDDPELEVVADAEPVPGLLVVEAPVCVLVLLKDGWLDVELPVVVVADDEPVFAVLVGEVGVRGLGRGRSSQRRCWAWRRSGCRAGLRARHPRGRRRTRRAAGRGRG